MRVDKYDIRISGIFSMDKNNLDSDRFTTRDVRTLNLAYLSKTTID